jgi:hypothetical protein
MADLYFLVIILEELRLSNFTTKTILRSCYCIAENT